MDGSVSLCSTFWGLLKFELSKTESENGLTFCEILGPIGFTAIGLGVGISSIITLNPT